MEPPAPSGLTVCSRGHLGRKGKKRDTMGRRTVPREETRPEIEPGTWTFVPATLSAAATRIGAGPLGEQDTGAGSRKAGREMDGNSCSPPSLRVGAGARA